MAQHQSGQPQGLDYQVAAPRLTLRACIARIWQIESQGSMQFSPGRWALPDGRSEWLFVLGDPLLREGRLLGPGGHVSGVTLRAQLSRPTGRLLVLGVVFEPGCAAAALGVMAREIAGRAAPLAEWWGVGADRLVDRLAQARRFSERVAILEDAIEVRLRPPDPEVELAVRRLAADPGTRIASLAASAAGARRLERKFLARVGVSQKRLARVFRLQKALRLLACGQAAGWADLAALSGYADQAHLTREFAELVGTSPQLAMRQRGMSVSFNTGARRSGRIQR